MASLDELERQIAEASNAVTDEVQRLQREQGITSDLYYHPEVRLKHDQLRLLLAQRDALLPDDHPEFAARAAAPSYKQEEALVSMRAALDRLHADAQITSADHTMLHASVDRSELLMGRAPARGA